MADRLTQLQDCLDQLAVQMFASLRYVNERHAPAIIPGQPILAVQPPGSTQDGETSQANTQTPGPSQQQRPQSQPESQSQQQQQQQQNEPDGPAPRPTSPVPDPPAVFDDALHELSRDLVAKEQQIEHLIGVLPGIGQTERAQRERMRELEAQLREVEDERAGAAREREELLRRVEAAICRVRRV